MDKELYDKCVMCLKEQYDEYDAMNACEMMLGYLESMRSEEPSPRAIKIVTDWVANDYPLATMGRVRQIHGHERFDEMVQIAEAD